ncbi:SphA family protein [Acidovorax sp. T1]|nr:transporter [Acidovorax sp. T1]
MPLHFPRRLTSLAATVATLTLGWIGPAQATEGGGTTAAAGTEGFLAGALPPPGTYGLLYANHYQADRFNDGQGNSAIPGFKVRADVLVGRVVHMTGTTLLGGQLGFYGVLPLVKLKVQAAGASDSRTGFGDIEAASLLAWHGPQWHTAAALAVVLPTGSYSATRMANPGNNITTLRPVVVASYLTESGLDLSTKLTYSINRKNSDTDYKSGQYLHADFNAGMRVAPAWQVGLQGYLIHQTTDDRQNGITAGPDGNRTRVLALGPALRWQTSPAAPSVELRWLKEIRARNHTKGDALWLKAVWAL